MKTYQIWTGYRYRNFKTLEDAKRAASLIVESTGIIVAITLKS